jgi:hypothetical protein
MIKKRKQRVRNNSVNRRRVGALQHRIGQLAKVDKNPRGSRAIAELAALKWIVETVIPEWMAEDPVVEVLWGGDPFVTKAHVEDVEALVGQMVWWRETEVSRRRACRVVGARFASAIDNENVLHLWLIPSDDPVPPDSQIINASQKRST